MKRLISFAGRPSVRRWYKEFAACLLVLAVGVARADHLAPTEPLVAFGDHSHEDHSSHDHSAQACVGEACEDLTNIRLDHSILAAANLSGTKLFGANLFSANLNHANLTNAILTDANLNSATLNYANLTGVVGLSGIQLASTSIVGINLSGVNLNGLNLTNQNLTDAVFTNASMRGVSLRFATLTNAELTGADLTNASLVQAIGLTDSQLQSAASIVGIELTAFDLTGFDLSGLDLTGALLLIANLFGADLTNTNLTNVILTGAGFIDATLTNANLTGVVGLTDLQLQHAGSIVGIDIGGLDLTGFNLIGLDLTGANLHNANLTNADLTDAVLREANLTNADLTDAVLRDADLTNATLSVADLIGATLVDADLTNAILASTNLTLANLIGADLTGAFLAGAILTNANLRNATLAGVNLTAAGLTGADFRGAILTGANFLDADLTDTDFSDANLSDALNLGLATSGPGTIYSLATDFTGTGFDPVAAGWTLAEDLDGDGLFNNVDVEPLTPSNAFDDGASPIPTTGFIASPGGQTLTIQDAPEATAGVLIRASGNPGAPIPREPAMITACDGAVTDFLSHGDELVVTCGSVTTEVLSGVVEIFFTGTGGAEATTTLSEGNTLTFEPTTFTFSAPDTNDEPAIVIVEGGEIAVAPGEEFDVIPVILDIKPGGDLNEINLGARRGVPVAVLTTEDFDAATVDFTTVEFGPAGAMILHRKGHLGDVDLDLDEDLELHFRPGETGLVCGETEASLVGELFDGSVIVGRDHLFTVACCGNGACEKTEDSGNCPIDCF
jgi:uncharacterized protein YjbI with pentapeptide repeats